MEAGAEDIDSVGDEARERGISSKITRLDLAREVRRPCWSSQVKIASAVILRIVRALLWMLVCISMLESSANRIG